MLKVYALHLHCKENEVKFVLEFYLKLVQTVFPISQEFAISEFRREFNTIQYLKYFISI